MATKTDKKSKLLGYSTKDLYNHIFSFSNFDFEKNFHIDHIFPIQAFVDYNIDDLSVINHLSNLRPLSKQDNLSKADKYDKNEFANWLSQFGILIEEQNQFI